MTTTVISNSAPFGSMTNSMISRLIGLNSTVLRLNEAVATASNGYTGTPGTEFETAIGNIPPGGNSFGVQPDPDTPGSKGSDYSYAVGELTQAWQAFWTAALPYIEQLDNGTPAM